MVLAIGLLSALAWGLLEIASDLMENIWPWLRRMSRLPEKRQEDEIGVPVWIVGSFERVMAFAFVLFLAPKDAFTLLGFWIGAKLAASWHRVPQEVDNKKNRDIRAGTLAALIAGIISVSFGVLIGLGIRWVFESHLIDDAISRE
jgi:hypothetical protein